MVRSLTDYIGIPEKVYDAEKVLSDWMSKNASPGWEFGYCADRRELWKIQEIITNGLENYIKNMKTPRYFIGEDESGHFYAVEADRRSEWEEWIDSGNSDTPGYATQLCYSLPCITFENWNYEQAIR